MILFPLSQCDTKKMIFWETHVLSLIKIDIKERSRYCPVASFSSENFKDAVADLIVIGIGPLISLNKTDEGYCKR